MAASEESIPTLKILIVGPSNSGKSALLIRYCDGLFDAESSTATIGVDFKMKKVSVHGRPYRLALLDTAGQERFRALSNSYYRGAHGVIICYDAADRASFALLERWYAEVEAYCGQAGGAGVPTFLVACKLDVVEEEEADGKRSSKAVASEEGERYAREKGSIGFCEASSKRGVGVRLPFVRVVEWVVARGAGVEVGAQRQGSVVRLDRGGAGAWGGGEGWCGC